MWKSLVFLLLFLEVCLCRSLNTTAPNNTRQVTQEELDFIAHMTKHSAIAQGKKIEQKFNGTEGSERFPNITLVQKFKTTGFTELEGYVARDDRNKTIIVAIRGSTSAAHAALNVLTLFGPNGLVPECQECHAHWGFQIAFERVLDAISAQVAEQVAGFPEYKLLITGHSLGGAISALLGIHYYRVGNNPLVVTFGQPRFGNKELAGYVNSKLVEPGNFYRVTYGNDPVVHLPLRDWGFEHSGGEYWIHSHRHPLTVHDIDVCLNGEDPRCLCGQSIEFLNRDHLGYFPNGLKSC